ncbi:MAG: VCBS repeat-containing protein [Armatimonadota bacterium]|nr:VCBS repeat-containing protein [Armatimonadota bacterium]
MRRTIFPRISHSASFLLVNILLVVALLILCDNSANAAFIWTSPCRYRILLSTNPVQPLSNSPVAIDMDFPQLLANMGSTETFDENTIEIVTYNSAASPKVYDASRSGYEKYLLPWRVSKYYGISRVTLSFPLISNTQKDYAVYFDTKESGIGKPDRPRGIVGDGDFFSEEYERREIGAGHMDTFCDFDGDGDQDLFKVTLEPYIYCYENIGSGGFEEKGKMTSNGVILTLPNNGEGRSWPALRFNDRDGDGDQDLFASFSDGSDMGFVVRFKNTTTPGGLITFTRVSDANNGRLLTVTGKSLVNPWFTSIAIVDWDGDGKLDVLSTPASYLEFNRNTGTGKDIANIELPGPKLWSSRLLSLLRLVRIFTLSRRTGAMA